MDTIRKHSKKRDAILSALRETDAHPSAEWVYHRLKPQIPDLSLGTVYRNLALFKASGEIVSLGTVNGLERFDGDISPHAHFVCQCCGQILDLPGLAVSKVLLEQAAELSESAVSSCKLLFSGRCKSCTENHL